METIRIKMDQYDLENLIRFIQNAHFNTQNQNYNQLILGICKQIMKKLENKYKRNSKISSIIFQKYEAIGLSCLYMDGKYHHKGDLDDLNLKIFIKSVIKYIKK